MYENETSLSRIQQSLFDPLQNRSIGDADWPLGADAIPVEALDANDRDTFLTEFSPSSIKVERVSDLPMNPQVVIGGLCSIFTGDLESGKAKEAVAQLRMDQLVESVGSVAGKTTFVIMEDSFFSRLTGLPLKDLQYQAAMAAERIARWLTMTTGTAPNLRIGYTSDPALASGIFEAVRYMANDVLKNPNFERMQSAPIIMMYTSIWTDLLSSLSYIPSSPVVCVEPAVHFIDSRTFPDGRLQNAYEDFTNWLRDNPRSKPGSANENLGIAGFLESVAGDQSKRRTRLLPWTNVPTTRNVSVCTNTLEENARLFPFPLRNSLIFTEAVNWGLWNPTIRGLLGTLIVLEEEYYRERGLIKSGSSSSLGRQELAQKLKSDYSSKAAPIMTSAAREISEILTFVLGV